MITAQIKTHLSPGTITLTQFESCISHCIWSCDVCAHPRPAPSWRGASLLAGSVEELCSDFLQLLNTNKWERQTGLRVSDLVCAVKALALYYAQQNVHTCLQGRVCWKYKTLLSDFTNSFIHCWCVWLRTCHPK